MIPLNFRVEPELIEALDKLQGKVTSPFGTVGRSQLLREALRRGLESIADELDN